MGWGCGGGRGGRRYGFHAMGGQVGRAMPPAASAEQPLDALKAQAQCLQDELEALRTRIDGLQTRESKD